MAYATLAQIQAAAGGASKLVQLADFDRDEHVDADVLAQAQAEVDAFIDGYCRVRYTTPVASPSLALQSVSAGEVVYWLRSKRGAITHDGPHYQEHLERISWLDKVSRGLVIPADAAGAAPAGATEQRSAWVERCTPYSGKGGPF